MFINDLIFIRITIPLYYNFLLSVCNNPIIGLNQFIRPIDLPKAQLDLYALTIVNGQPGLHEDERKEKR